MSATLRQLFCVKRAGFLIESDFRNNDQHKILVYARREISIKAWNRISQWSIKCKLMPRIVSWNINGVRSLPQPLPQILSTLDADVCCFQETKITRSALDTSIAFVDGYNSYFAFCRKREGYSGVATYCKDDCGPECAVEGLHLLQSSNYVLEANGTSLNSETKSTTLGPDCFTADELKTLNDEGRAVITRHLLEIIPSVADRPDCTVAITSATDDHHVAPGVNASQNEVPLRRKYLTVINVYCPRLDPEREDRRDFKKNFYRLLELYASQILASGDHVVIVGDLNCSHKRIDHCDPDSDPEFDENESRKWMDNFLYALVNSRNNGRTDPSKASSGKFVDLFRFLYPDTTNAFTCWRHYGNARATNFGSRIDYAIGDYGLIQSNLLDDVKHLTNISGSDHCPVELSLKNCRFEPSEVLPQLCTKFMPEFKGVQQVLDGFLVKRSAYEDAGSRQGKKMKASVRTNPVYAGQSRTLTDYFSLNSIPSRRISNSNGFPLSTEKKEEAPLHTPCASSSVASAPNAKESATKWDVLFNQAHKMPLCRGHHEPCILKISKKPGPNYNRSFYACARPVGSRTDANANCNHFQWSK